MVYLTPLSHFVKQKPSISEVWYYICEILWSNHYCELHWNVDIAQKRNRLDSRTNEKNKKTNIEKWQERSQGRTGAREKKRRTSDFLGISAQNVTSGHSAGPREVGSAPGDYWRKKTPKKPLYSLE